MTQDFSLIYNSNVFDPRNASGTIYPGGGWQYGYNYSLIEDQSDDYTCGSLSLLPRYRMVLIYPDGSHHALHLYNRGDDDGDGFTIVEGFDGLTYNGTCQLLTPVSGPLTYHTSDGTFVKVVINPGVDWYAYFPDGTVAHGTSWYPAYSITDRNGNTVFMTSLVDIGVGQTSTILNDVALGRQIWYTNNFNISQDVVTQIGSNSGSSGAQELTWTINWRTVTGFSYMCGMSTCYLNNYAVDTLILPSFDGTTQQYQFGYDVDTTPGSIGLMTLILPPTAPSGCTKSNATNCPRFTYSYFNNGIGRPYPNWQGAAILAQKQRIWQEDQTGQQRTETWTYSYTSTNDSTTVRNPDYGQVTYDYGALTQSNPVWNEGLVTKIIQPDQSTVERIWLRNLPGPMGSEQYGPGNPYMQTEFRSVSNSSPSPTLMNARNYTYDKNGNATEIDEYGLADRDRSRLSKRNFTPESQSHRGRLLSFSVTPCSVVTKRFFAQTGDSKCPR